MGSEWLATREIEAPPLQSLALRYLLAAAILAIAVISGKLRFLRGKGLVSGTLTGVTMLALPAILTVWARGRISPGLLVVILSMTPLIAALIEGQATGMLLTALVAGVGGTALIASQGLSFSWTQGSGAVAVLGAATLIAGSIMYLKRVLPAAQPLALAAVQLGTGAGFLLLVSLVVERDVSFAWTREAVVLQILVSVLGNALAFPLYYWLLSSLESFQLTASQWIIPVVGLAESLILARVAPSWRIMCGAAILAFSVWAVLRFVSGDDAPLTIEVTGRNSRG